MKLRIFVIDDEECIRDSFKWYLESHGHEVLSASEPMLCDIYNGRCCTQKHACGDVLFVDYNMPHMTGLEFIELMSERGCKGHPENKIIMSGSTASIDMDRARKVNCQVVQKPLSFEELDTIIRHAKERLDPERELADLSY